MGLLGKINYNKVTLKLMLMFFQVQGYLKIIIIFFNAQKNDQINSHNIHKQVQNHSFQVLEKKNEVLIFNFPKIHQFQLEDRPHQKTNLI